MDYSTKLVTVAVASIVAALTLSSSTHAQPRSTTCNNAPANGFLLLDYNQPFRFYLADSFRPYRRGPMKLPSMTSPICGSSLVVWRQWQHFYVLFNAFPDKPTPAQWKARWTPLVAAAITVDTDLIPIAERDLRNLQKLSPPTPAHLRLDIAWLRAHLHTRYGQAVK